MTSLAPKHDATQPPRNVDSFVRPVIRRTVVPANDVAEAVQKLELVLESRLAQIEAQVSAVAQFMSHPSTGTAPASQLPEAPPIAVSCLGAFQLTVHGTPVDTWRSSKARALFQYLVNHRGRLIPRDTLIQALWPNPDAVAAGTSLKVAVHALRQTLGMAAGEKVALAVQSHDCGYQLAATHVWIDVEEFERCYALGRTFEAQGRSSDALAWYARAADLYRGDFLEELTDDWPMFRREALKDQYLFVVTCLANSAVEMGDFQGGIVRCQQLLAKDRCREDAYRLLMICHGRLRQRSRVRSWFEFCVRTLRTELDCGPEPETERTYQRALLGKA